MATVVSKEYSEAVLSAVAGASASVFTEFEVALLTGAATATSGTLDISSVELSGTGYARITVPVTDFELPAGNNPVYVANSNVLYSPYNTGAVDWDDITHIAILDSDVVLQVVDVATPITVTPDSRVKIDAGDLKIALGSV